MILTKNLLNVKPLFFIVNISGKQKVFFYNTYVDVLFIRNTNCGDIIKFNRILFFYKLDNFITIQIGKPFVKNICIFAIIIQHFFTSKIIIFKYKRKKNYIRKQGFKIKKTRIFIPKISKHYGT